jgi:hypothetical protein
MRIALIGLIAVSAALTTACTAPVGSPEWCKQMQEKMKGADSLEAITKLSPEEQQGLGQCMMNALQGVAPPQ